MYRRKLLLAGGASLAVTVAGCSDNGDNGDGDDEAPADDGNGDTDESTPEEEASAEFPGFDLEAFDEVGLDSGGLNRANGRINLDYNSPSSSESDLGDELEDVGFALGDAVEDIDEFSSEFDLIEGLIDADDGSLWEYDIEVDLIAEYVNEEIDADEYADGVRESLEELDF